MDIKFLEQYYEKVVLPLFGDAVPLSGISWKDHGRVGLDTYAHYFDNGHGREYVLIYENFPGSEYLNDDLTHDIVPCGDEASARVMTSSEKTIDNMTGYFTLYAEKAQR